MYGKTNEAGVYIISRNEQGCRNGSTEEQWSMVDLWLYSGNAGMVTYNLLTLAVRTSKAVTYVQ